MLEFRRQIAHLLFGLLLVLLIYFDIIGYKIVGILFIISLLIPYLCKIQHFNKFVCYLERESETNSFRAKGLVFYLLGVFFSLILFDKNIALASITILAIGDSISTIRGRVKHPFNDKKYLEASILAWLISGFVASLFVPFYASYIASFVAMLIESFDCKIYGTKIDDNLIIPLVAGLVMTLIQYSL